MLAAVAVATAIGGLQYRSAMQARLAAQQARLAEEQARLAEQQTRAARELAEAKVSESELEQGRAALLHGEPEAAAHLMEAYKRDPSPSTAFMLARSMQPRLAEQARFASTYGRMWSAVFSPDGRQIATTDDRAAQIGIRRRTVQQWRHRRHSRWMSASRRPLGVLASIAVARRQARAVFARPQARRAARRRLLSPNAALVRIYGLVVALTFFEESWRAGAGD